MTKNTRSGTSDKLTAAIRKAASEVRDIPAQTTQVELGNDGVLTVEILDYPNAACIVYVSGGSPERVAMYDLLAEEDISNTRGLIDIAVRRFLAEAGGERTPRPRRAARQAHGRGVRRSLGGGRARMATGRAA